jgi:vacuolar-type H+-ATPase subunit I/STV1
MKILQILTLLSVLAFSFSVLAQEKENEKPKEAEKVKESEKPKEVEKTKTSDSHEFIVQFWTSRARTASIPNEPANVIDIELVSANLVNYEFNDDLCSSEKNENIEIIAKSNENIEVFTNAKDKENDNLTYAYTVSGGKIIGQGKKVFWDLSGVKPGTYTITAAVDDGCGFCGRTVTKTIIVRE